MTSSKCCNITAQRPPEHQPVTALPPAGTNAARDDQATDLMRAALISDHLGLARAVARRYTHRGVDAEDLYQVASLALVQAAARFDTARGTPLLGMPRCVCTVN
ncbi:MAG: hypothetical protein M3Y49_16370 [Actinomycetota bacterium]|nr:hypothetical protein [Actinomycetota bacterium]